MSDQKFDNIMEKLGGFEKKIRELTKEREGLVKEVGEKSLQIEALKEGDAKNLVTIESMKEKCKNLQQLLDNSTKESSHRDSHRKDIEN